MGVQFNIAEATAKLAELIARAEAGEDVVIARAGKPAVRLVAMKAEKRVPVLGGFEHLGPVADDAFDPDPNDAVMLPDPILVAAGIEKP